MRVCRAATPTFALAPRSPASTSLTSISPSATLSGPDPRSTGIAHRRPTERGHPAECEIHRLLQACPLPFCPYGSAGGDVHTPQLRRSGQPPRRPRRLLATGPGGPRGPSALSFADILTAPAPGPAAFQVHEPFWRALPSRQFAARSAARWSAPPRYSPPAIRACRPLGRTTLQTCDFLRRFVARSRPDGGQPGGGADPTGCDLFQALTAGAKWRTPDLRGVEASGPSLGGPGQLRGIEDHARHSSRPCSSPWASTSTRIGGAAEVPAS